MHISLIDIGIHKVSSTIRTRLTTGGSNDMEFLPLGDTTSVSIVVFDMMTQHLLDLYLFVDALSVRYHRVDQRMR